MYRISVTTLEAYRRYASGKYEYLTMESVIDAMKGVFTGTTCYADIGSAFHRIVEQGAEGFIRTPDGLNTIEVDDGAKVTMNDTQVRIALKYRKQMPQAFHELVLGKEFRTDAFPIWVEGRCDILHGLTVRDIKTKYSPIRLEDYTDSAQWRLYLELTGLDTFYYDMFEFLRYKPEVHGWDVSGLELVSQYSIECIRYGNMESDNANLVNDFTGFVASHKLENLLKIKGQ